MAESNELTVGRKLNEIFEEAYNLFYSFKTCYDPTNSPEFQVTVLQSLFQFQHSIIKIYILGKNKKMYWSIRGLYQVGQFDWNVQYK
jgi:hypothetical protein